MNLKCIFNFVGFIIRDYLSEDQKAKQFLEDLEKEHSEYNGFNLVLLEKQLASITIYLVILNKKSINLM